ncbi:unnamed protein product [Bursaphelenchus okinawaensis]|uniref:Peptidase S54 rhomboid domain-containing protein n=1 Tax=Bursaphelenchus okinawaensis TaxID=465554 RepID=A0A811LDZ8_9BILA|nr:unnamed protein product [Bursaphelenchus okinawaensis]CAG9122122.1 unnamed protein product [Bursaphelenchus okinawaensis]
MGSKVRRNESIREKISHGSAKFFGVPMTDDNNSLNSDHEQTKAQETKWQKRRYRYLNSLYGVKEKQVAEEMKSVDTLDSGTPYLENASVYTAIPMEPEKKESVARMAYNAFQSFIQGDLFRRRRLTTLAEEEPVASTSASPPPPYTPIRERIKVRNMRSFPLTQHNVVQQPRRLARNQSVDERRQYDTGNVEYGTQGQYVAERGQYGGQGQYSGQGQFSGQGQYGGQVQYEAGLRPSSAGAGQYSTTKGRVGSSASTEGLQESTGRFLAGYVASDGQEMDSKPQILRSSPSEHQNLPGTSLGSQDFNAQSTPLSPRNIRAPSRERPYLNRPRTSSERPELRRPAQSMAVEVVGTERSSEGLNLKGRRTPSLQRDEPSTSTRPNLHRQVHRTDRPTEWIQPLFLSMRSRDPEEAIEMQEWPKRQRPSFYTYDEFHQEYLPGDELIEEFDHIPMPITKIRQFPVDQVDRYPEGARSLTVNEHQQQYQHYPRTPTASTPGRHGLRDLIRQKEKIQCGGLSVADVRQRIAYQPRTEAKETNPFWACFWSCFCGLFGRRPRKRDALPMFGKFKRRYRVDPEIGRAKKILQDESDDCRPFFTYWITTTQAIIMVFTLMHFGIGTDFFGGFGVTERSGDVFATSMSSVHIVVWEQNNIWIGARFADLVHIGAKYTPCMRRDARIHKLITEEREIENSETGCCIGPDGCFQTSSCPQQFATFHKYINNDKTQQRIVCGQDPRFCATPRSAAPYDWGPNITDWPQCQQQMENITTREPHMHCPLVGRPCCIQMHGQCRITTREYCDFVRGYYHENATLCSQVSCLNDVCGMTPFLMKDVPDQFYRFVIPLFIHAGIIRFAITCIIQLYFMRKFEQAIGSLRLAIIYFVSGVGGYLASASFEPYMPEVGPAGSQGGVLGALIIDVIYNWQFLSNPVRALLLHLLLALLLFITGFLPYVDNWAHIFGFIFGCLASAALIPYMQFGDKGTRLLVVVFSIITTIVMFVFLLVLFYGLPVINSPILTFLNCPFSGHICDQQGLKLRSWLPI